MISLEEEDKNRESKGHLRGHHCKSEPEFKLGPKNKNVCYYDLKIDHQNQQLDIEMSFRKWKADKAKIIKIQFCHGCRGMSEQQGVHDPNVHGCRGMSEEQGIHAPNVHHFTQFSCRKCQIEFPDFVNTKS